MKDVDRRIRNIERKFVDASMREMRWGEGRERETEVGWERRINR